jgi:hypothetical protein
MDDKRAPVQGNRRLKKVPGTVSWQEHIEAWEAYDKKYHCNQSVERIADRGGFCYGELCEFLGRAPETWKPR